MIKVVYNKSYGGFGLSEKADAWLQARGFFYKKINGHFEEVDEIPRHHPLLVECVETLGKEANGQYANLQITEVSGKYFIDEYDGKEKVITPEVVEKWWINPTK